ncbi:MAG: exodeoxyribonuclease VII large subunit [Dehalococcoidia bacterium]|jgi:exodeoxyribonuclease VII large subunit|nr:exodeoxyribonuclease VII large subunit [Dehalococcoidia bacterium]|tara:strand:+ start:6996 stop:8270 length:1275 start_codon:yes stop_codon:yes gene_type:complete
MTSSEESDEAASSRQTAYTVSAVAEYLKASLESDPRLADLMVVGEVSGYRNPSSGHHYFALRDEQSVLRCVMFRGGRGGQFLSDGSQVICHGRISIYTARGDLQYYVDQVEPDGVGALQKAFEEMRKRLESEGLFESGRKRQLPAMPARIAVITSPTGAVIQDILNVLTRRYPLAEVILIPTAVQGEKAAPEIVRAFQALNALDDIDVAIVARGGGSLEDLWSFNEETVARAIFASNVPVISAIGHETDTTIADLVADVCAPTPSAAAEIVAPATADLAGEVAGYAARIDEIVGRRVADSRSHFELAVDRMNLRVPDTALPRQRIDDLLVRARLAGQRLVESSKLRLAAVEASLSALGPKKILGRGYTITRLADGKAATSALQFETGDRMAVTFADGSVDATVDRSSPDTAPGSDGSEDGADDS